MKSTSVFLWRIDNFFKQSEALGEMLTPGVTALVLGQTLPNPWTVASTGTHAEKCNIVFWWDTWKIGFAICKIDFSSISQKRRVATTAGRSRGLSATVPNRNKSREAGSDLATLHPTSYHEFSSKPSIFRYFHPGKLGPALVRWFRGPHKHAHATLATFTNLV